MDQENLISNPIDQKYSLLVLLAAFSVFVFISSLVATYVGGWHPLMFVISTVLSIFVMGSFNTRLRGVLSKQKRNYWLVALVIITCLAIILFVAGILSNLGEAGLGLFLIVLPSIFLLLIAILMSVISLKALPYLLVSNKRTFVSLLIGVIVLSLGATGYSFVMGGYTHSQQILNSDEANFQESLKTDSSDACGEISNIEKRDTCYLFAAEEKGDPQGCEYITVQETINLCKEKIHLQQIVTNRDSDKIVAYVNSRFEECEAEYGGIYFDDFMLCLAGRGAIYRDVASTVDRAATEGFKALYDKYYNIKNDPHVSFLLPCITPYAFDIEKIEQSILDYKQCMLELSKLPEVTSVEEYKIICDSLAGGQKKNCESIYSGIQTRAN